MTEIHLRKKGWWKMGAMLFRDRITIFRVFAANTRRARSFFRKLKEQLKSNLRQQEILIVEKAANIL